MKKCLIIAGLFIYQSLNAQFRVDPSGNVGIGTSWPNAGHKLDVRGNILLSNHPATPNHSLRLVLWNGGPGPEISTSDDNVIFWDTWVAYHNLYAANYYKVSDIKYKSNVKTIENGLQLINKIRPVYYNIVDNKFDSLGNKVEGTSQQIGFISQEIQKEFPNFDITSSTKGDILLDYDQIIPITVASIQEQQKTIDSLKNELMLLKEQFKSKSSLGVENSSPTSNKQEHTLNQNVPNPFNQNTEISFTINEKNFQNASIVIFDMNGSLVAKHDIMKAGESSIIIHANELKAGMYIYSLIVNQVEIDSKRMILLN